MLAKTLISLDEELLIQAKIEAVKTRTSFSALVRKLLKEYLKTKK